MILGKKCALVRNKCNSCKKNMQEFSSRLIQPIYDKGTKFHSNFVPGGGGGGTTRPLPRDGGVEELRGDPTVGPHPKVWTIDRE